MNIPKTKRNANIELLRILSIIMVTFLHALGKSNLLVTLNGDAMANPNVWIAWILETLCIGAVNIFMLISGYFLVESEFRIGRLIEIIAQTVFYSLGTFIVCYCLGIAGRDQVSVYDFLNYIFPVHMEVFWFISAYVLVYILQPVLSKGIKDVSRNNLKMVIILLVVYECIVKSVLPVRLQADDKGYTFLWYITVFLIGAYFRLYGFKFIKSTGKGLGIYFLFSLLNVVLIAGIQHVNVYMGHFAEIMNYSIEYNHVLVLLPSIGIFAAFVNMEDKKNRVSDIICLLSPMSLGVYLLHENLTLRFKWQGWLGLDGILNANPVYFVFRIMLAVLVVYVIGTVVDYLRIKIFNIFKLFVGKNKDK